MLLTVKRDNIIYVLLLIITANPVRIIAQECMCCSQATGYCKTICEKISLVEIASDANVKNNTLQEIQTYCSSQLNSFWECLNATFKEISRGELWSGRVCCTLPLSETCKRSCVTAISEYDLYQGCRQSDEIDFFSCIDKQNQGESCCSHARTNDCRNACTEIFKNHLTPSKIQRNQVISQCEYSSPKVLNCIKNFTKVTPATNLHKQIHCCDKSNKSKCREACKNALLTTVTHQEAIDMLELGGCGLPLLQDQFWQCFFKSDDTVATSVEVSRIEKVGMDSAKWHCCQKATTTHCKRLCSKTFRKDWSTSWEQFHLKCLSQISEEPLRNCIDEVEEPCELGCDGLSFCTNFNNRPTELFRSCTPQADEAARNDVTIWNSQNDLSLPGLNLPLKNISECSPNTWKTVACTLHIKPCSRHSHANQICRDICLEIISLCIDWTAVPLEHTPESICDKLSPEHPDVSCISLQNYLRPADNTYQTASGQVSSPCKGDPCTSDQVCIVNRNCIGSSCSPYKCVSGCKLGEVSEYMVPDGTFVRIPMPNNPKGCLQICKCTNGRIEACQPLPCVPLNPCVIGNSEYKEHGSVYSKECNTCTCFAEENICTKKQCQANFATGKDSTFTTLPCNYPPHYIPVCGRNGNTYPSSSLAKCAGLNDSDIEYGACPDPCKNNPCGIGHKCVPDTQVCLSLNQKPCMQYQCINGTLNCNDLPKDPVCDIDNHEYKNSCFLAHHNSKFAYQGPCLSGCKYTGKVCGINGKTYISECAAWADYVSVDYIGPCVTVGLITNSNAKQCASIKCGPLPDLKCIGITPPGACCPICGGAIRLLYSSRQIDRALYALQNKSTSPISLNGVLKALQRHIQVAQCTLRGFLSVEADIFVVVQTTEKYPSQLQLEACVREAEKLASLVNKQSPRIVSELSLSCLTTAMTVHSHSSVNSFKQYNAAISVHIFTQFGYLLNILIIFFLVS
ncbi:hypothetical protein RI129_009856 [Pyrocoelia pectoralis]|uniref:Kazal-like domain-containing protein n=1 Tax=Pyrocoelia pectoralis TaxID=417401 RepID=A0AAN7VCD8_9COLE